MTVTCCPRFLGLIAVAIVAVGVAVAAQSDDANPVKLGPNAAIGKRLFPDDNPWNQDISKAPIDPNSAKLIASIGNDRPLHPDFGTVWQGEPSGIPYVVVSGKQPKVPISYEYADESDPGL